jgi:hypothetical protein
MKMEGTFSPETLIDFFTGLYIVMLRPRETELFTFDTVWTLYKAAVDTFSRSLLPGYLCKTELLTVSLTRQ